MSAKGITPSGPPNFVIGANQQVCWEKAARYFEIECRASPVSADSLVLTAERAKVLCDENTVSCND